MDYPQQNLSKQLLVAMFILLIFINKSGITAVRLYGVKGICFCCCTVKDLPQRGLPLS
jgi:hypothetical protein